MSKVTTEVLVARFKSIHGDKFDYSEVVYTGSKNKVLIKCQEGHEVLVYPDNHTKGFGCKKCSGVNQKTQDEFIHKAIEVHNNLYKYNNVKYTRCDTKILITCEKHGDFLQTPASHLSGRGCPKCCGMHKTTRDFVLEAKKIHGNRYTYEKANYVKNSTKLIITCTKHGDFLQVPYSHIAGAGCPVCSGNARTTPVSFVEKAAQIHGGRYDYTKTKFRKSHYPVVITCMEHGDFKTTPGNHLAGKGCPRCTHQISSQEETLIKEFPIFDQTVRDIIPPKHLDLYSEKHKLAIEVDGKYWHSEQKGKTKEYRINKTIECQNKGVTLLHFWDDEVVGKLEIVKSMISSRLGRSTRIFGRKTDLVQPTKSEVKSFLEENHLQGSSGYSVAYGLMHNNQLVSVMTMGKARFSKDYDWEIIRLATKLGISVVGGASKLFCAFTREYKPQSVITYADRRYSEGKVYEKLGFIFKHNSAPSYFYIRGNESIPRYKAQKHKLPMLLGDKFNPSLSESKNMKAAGYSKVWDCGNKVFIKIF